MATATDPDGLQDFVELYNEFQHYPAPESLAQAAQLNPRLLRHYQGDVLGGLAGARRSVLFVDDDIQKIPFREVDKYGKVVKWNCLSDEELREWLRNGNVSYRDENPLDVRRQDPRCRFVFLINEDRGEPLQISQSGLARLLTFHQVSPNFLDVLDAYRGSWTDEREFRFTIFRTSATLSDPPPSTVIRTLDRSGRRYQITFNMKIPTTRQRAHGQFYKIRQVALHHQLDIETGVQLWLVGDPHGLVKERIQAFLPAKRSTATFGTLQESFRSSLSIHLEIIRWTIELWSRYVEDLQDNIQQMTDIVLQVRDPITSSDADSINNPTISLPPVAAMQELADQAGKALMVLLSNERIIRLLEAFYKQTLEDPELHSDPDIVNGFKHSFKRFKTELGELKSQQEMHLDHVRGLKDMVEGRKEIIAQQSQKNTTIVLNKQALRSANEAVMMRIITIITLFYLPPTFTSTFFSMDMFKDVGVTMWAAVSIPLLVVTMIFAAAGGVWALRRARRRHRDLLRRLNQEDLEPSWEQIRTKEALYARYFWAKGLLTRLRNKLWRKDDVDLDLDTGGKDSPSNGWREEGEEDKWSVKKALKNMLGAEWLRPHWAMRDRPYDLEGGSIVESHGDESQRRNSK